MKHSAHRNIHAGQESIHQLFQFFSKEKIAQNLDSRDRFNIPWGITTRNATEWEELLLLPLLLTASRIIEGRKDLPGRDQPFAQHGQVHH